MKRLGWILLVTGVIMIGGGVVFCFLAGLATCDESCIKSRLGTVLEAKGYTVRLDRGTYEYIPLYVREQLERVDRGELENLPREQMVERLRQARVIHFMEVEAGQYFFFIERFSPILLGAKTEEVEERTKENELSFDPRNTTLIHVHNGTFLVTVIGKLIFSEKEVENTFPFEETKRITRWQEDLGLRVRRRGILLGITFLLFGGGTIGFFYLASLYKEQLQPIGGAAIAYSAEIFTQKTSPPHRPPERPPPPAKEDIGALRLRVISALDELIAKHDGEELRGYFQSMRLEAQGEKRIARLDYILTHRIPSILEQNLNIDLIEEGSIDALPPRGEIFEKAYPQLSIDSLIPPGLSRDCVKAILLELLGIGGKPPFFGLHRCRYESLQRWVMSREFSVQEWRESFEWLRKHGVLLYENPHRTGFSCSINPKKQKAFPPGDQIIGILVALRRQIEKGSLN